MTPGLEQELLRRYVEQNDAEAFRELVENHRDMVFSVCKRILRNAADAEDAAQNSFLQLARKARRLKAPIAGWLHHIAVQISINMHKQNAARTARQTKAAALRASTREPTWDELQGAIDEVIARLPERLRVPVILHYLEGRKQEEIAAELGITQSAVSKRLAHGIETLRKRLTKSGAILSGVALATLLAANSVEAAPATLILDGGKMAFAGLASGAKAATTAGAAVLKWGIGIAIAVAAILTGVVVAQKETSSTTTQPVVFAPGAPTLEVEATEKQGGNLILGKVLLPDGRPAEGATVRFYYCHDSTGYGSCALGQATTDIQGRFKLAWPKYEPPPLVPICPSLRYILVATREGYAPGMAFPGAQIGQEQLVQLEEGRTIEVAVDERGRPAEGAKVSVLLTHDRWNLTDRHSSDPYGLEPFSGDLVSARSDARGRVLFSGFPLEGAFVEASLGGKQDAALPEIEQSASPVTLELRSRMAWIRGVVTGAEDGKPLAGMVVSPYPATSWVMTDAEGRFAIRVDVSELSSRLGLDPHAPLPVLRVQDPAFEPSYASAFVLGTGFDPQKELTIGMIRGERVRVRVADADTGKPLAGVCVQAKPPVRAPDDARQERREAGADGQLTPNQRLTDREGNACFCLPPNQETEFKAIRATGYAVTLSDAPRATIAPNTLPERGITVNASVLPEAIANIVVKTIDGWATPRASLLIVASTGPASAYFTGTGADNRLRLMGLAAGADLEIEGRSGEQDMAGFATVAGLKPGSSPPIEVILQPARKGRIIVKDEQDRAVPASVIVWALSRDRFSTAPHNCTWDAGRLDYAVPGLVPNHEYIVSVTKEGYVQDEDRSWQFGEDEETPTAIVQLRLPRPAQAEPTAAGVARISPEEEFTQSLASLKDAQWSKADPEQTNLTWYALNEGIALADANSKQVKRFTELLGERDFVPSSIAFGKDKVWLGTNKGLFAWDRKDMFWTRFAVGGKFVDLPVRGLSLTDTGKLLVTIERDAKSHTFEYDTKALTWRELP